MNSIDISLTAIGKPEKLLSIVTLPVVMRLILYPILLNISSDILVLASIRLSSVVLVQYLTVNLLHKYLDFNFKYYYPAKILSFCVIIIFSNLLLSDRIFIFPVIIWLFTFIITCYKDTKHIIFYFKDYTNDSYDN